MAKAYGKTYGMIVRAVADAKMRGEEDPVIFVSSERMKRRVVRNRTSDRDDGESGGQYKQMGMKDYLEKKGWLFRGGVMVRFSNPRLGWKSDGTLIVGYHEWPEKVCTVTDLEAVLAKLRLDPL